MAAARCPPSFKTRNDRVWVSPPIKSKTTSTFSRRTFSNCAAEIIDDAAGSDGLEVRRIVGPCRRNDGGAGMRCQLHRVGAYGAGTTMDQDRLSLVQLTVGENSLPRSLGGHRHRCRLLEGEVGWFPCDGGRLDRQILRVRAHLPMWVNSSVTSISHCLIAASSSLEPMFNVIACTGCAGWPSLRMLSASSSCEIDCPPTPIASCAAATRPRCCTRRDDNRRAPADCDPRVRSTFYRQEPSFRRSSRWRSLPGSRR